MSILRSFWISALLGVSFLVSAQNNEPNATTLKLPKEKHSYWPTGFRVGANVARLSRSVFDQGYSSWGVTGDIDFYRFMLEVAYGRENNQNTDGDFTYDVDGDFFKFGVDANFITNPERGNALVIGLKYNLGSYNELLTFQQESNFSSEMISLNNDNIRARWAELNFGVKGKVVSNFHAGFYLRFKVAKKILDETNFETYQLPGFGLNSSDSRVGIDYYIMWRIPFKSATEI